MESSLAILAGIFGLGTTELVVILIILLVLFGGAKLPGLAKGLGQSIKEFKKATNEEEKADESTAVKKEAPKETHGSN